MKQSVKDLLSLHELELAEAIQKAVKNVQEAEVVLDILCARCTHVFEPLTPKMLLELEKGSPASWKYNHAVCLICVFDLGYRCPKSPDSVCHYDSEDGVVQLVTKELVPFQKVTILNMKLAILAFFVTHQRSENECTSWICC
jgi:hypothetical protein